MRKRPRVWLIGALMLAVAAVACVAQAPPATQPVESPTVQKMTLFELLLKGRWFMVPIGLCSLLGLAIIIERLVALRRKAVIPRGFLAELKTVLHHSRGDRARGLEFCRRRDCPIARVVAAGIAKFHKGEEVVERAIEDAGAAEVQKLRRNLQMLFAVAAVSPMLGLLGTVWGMKAQYLATGIYEALVTTFAGLVVAIPALIFFYYFRGKIEQIVSALNDASVEFAEFYLAGNEVPSPRVPVGAVNDGPEGDK